MKGAALLIVAGTWVLCQVLGGKALRRLNIVTSGPAAAASGPSGGSGSADTGGGGGVVV